MTDTTVQKAAMANLIGEWIIRGYIGYAHDIFIAFTSGFSHEEAVSFSNVVIDYILSRNKMYYLKNIGIEKWGDDIQNE